MRRLRQPQDDVAICLARSAHLAEPVDELGRKPDPYQPVGPGRGVALACVEARKTNQLRSAEPSTWAMLLLGFAGYRALVICLMLMW